MASISFVLLVFAFVLLALSAYLGRLSLPHALLAGGLALWVLAIIVGGFPAHA